jgi:hypothetical protein
MRKPIKRKPIKKLKPKKRRPPPSPKSGRTNEILLKKLAQLRDEKVSAAVAVGLRDAEPPTRPESRLHEWHGEGDSRCCRYCGRTWLAAPEICFARIHRNRKFNWRVPDS